MFTVCLACSTACSRVVGGRPRSEQHVGVAVQRSIFVLLGAGGQRRTRIFVATQHDPCGVFPEMDGASASRKGGKH